MKLHIHRATQLGHGLALLLLSGAFGSVSASDFVYTVQPGDHPWILAQCYLPPPGLRVETSWSRINRPPHR